MARTPHPTRHHGVSLVEALVALVVVAFGMLSLVNVQSTMRLNVDLAGQRTEATHIATEEIENLRLFDAVQTGNSSWDNIASRTVDPYPQASGTGNTSYRLVRTVSAASFSSHKVVTVQVLWTDRTGTEQSVRIDTVVAGIDPALSGLISVLH
ncbi:MAG: hypothetical protein EBY28_09600 [Betaproteobacteria bacterium]|nr:hypothetical protein [Betaproteobacteria bacterium]